jgi:hypothetical protein
MLSKPAIEALPRSVCSARIASSLSASATDHVGVYETLFQHLEVERRFLFEQRERFRVFDRHLCQIRLRQLVQADLFSRCGAADRHDRRIDRRFVRELFQVPARRSTSAFSMIIAIWPSATACGFRMPDTAPAPPCALRA